MDNERYTWMVASQPDPDKLEEYNQWYDNHVETFFKFQGLKKVVRHKCFQPMQNPDSCPRYVVIYEFDTKDDLEAFLTSDAAEIAKKQYEEDWNGLGEFLWSGWYEPVKKLER